MDGKQILDAAEWCVKHIDCEGCINGIDGERFNDNCPLQMQNMAETLLAVRDHVRSQAITQVREWASKTSVEEMTTECCGRLLAMLDELSKEGMDNARRTVEGAYCD